MRRKPDGSRRIVLAYMSIGQAETFRWYWPQRSASLARRQGQAELRRAFLAGGLAEDIFEYTEKIVTAGFDGVYLDHVDEFEDKGRKDDMVEFVARISAKAKSSRADFMVVPQNGDALIATPSSAGRSMALRAKICSTAKAARASATAQPPSRDLRRLKMLAAEGKPVLVVEYPRNDEQAKTWRGEISENSFIGLIARRTLNQL